MTSPMEDTDLFPTPLSQTRALAVEVANEAYAGALGDAAEAAYRTESEYFAGLAGLTAEDVEALDTPKSWLGRLWERIEDWWWDIRDAITFFQAQEEDADLGAIFAFPVPLLRTHPLQDTPLEYAEVDQRMAAATSDIIADISQKTDWTPVPFQTPKPTDEDMDPFEQILAVWENQSDQAFLILIDQCEEDPKLLGQALGLVRLEGPFARSFEARFH